MGDSERILSTFVAQAEPLPSPLSAVGQDLLQEVFRELRGAFLQQLETDASGAEEIEVGGVLSANNDSDRPPIISALAFKALRLSLRDGDLAIKQLGDDAGTGEGTLLRLWGVCLRCGGLHLAEQKGAQTEKGVEENDVEMENEALKCVVNLASMAAEKCFAGRAGLQVAEAVAASLSRFAGANSDDRFDACDPRVFPLCRLASQVWKYERGLETKPPAEVAEWSAVWREKLPLGCFATLLERALQSAREGATDGSATIVTVGETLRMIFCLTSKYGGLSADPLVLPDDLSTLSQLPGSGAEKIALVAELRRVARALKQTSQLTSVKTKTGPPSAAVIPLLFDAHQFACNVLANLPLPVVLEVMDEDWLRRIVGVIGQLLERKDFDGLAPPLLAATRIVGQNKKYADSVARNLFPEAIVVAPRAAITVEGPQLGNSVANQLRPMLMAPNTAVRHVVSDFLFTICNNDARKFARRLGFGSTAGWLQHLGLLAEVQAAMGAEAGDPGDDVNVIGQKVEEL